MKIISITRVISGPSYDNISATATLDKNEDVIKASKELDTILKQALDEIANQTLGKMVDTELPF